MACGGDVTNEKPPPSLRTIDEIYDDFGLVASSHAPYKDKETADLLRKVNDLEREVTRLEKENKKLSADIDDMGAPSFLDDKGTGKESAGSEKVVLEEELTESRKEVERVERDDSRRNTVNRSSRNNGASGDDDVWLDKTFEVTFYTAYCPSGCTGVTATGIDVSNTIYHEGRRIIAADPNVIPLGSTVKVTLSNGQSFEAIVADTGGAIRGRKIDVLVASREEAKRYGRQTAKIDIIKRGGR